MIARPKIGRTSGKRPRYEPLKLGISLSFAALRAAGVVEEEGRRRPRVVGDARDDGPRGQAAGRAADGQRVRRRDGEHDGVEGLRDARARRPLRRRDDLGSTRVIQRRFNVSVPRARVPEKASTLRDRSER